MPRFWYVSGLTTLGALTGFVVALSQSPVVGVLLPLLFGLLGGAGGIYVFRVDLSAPAERLRLSLFGMSVTGFSLGALLVCGVTLTRWDPGRTKDAANVDSIEFAQLTPDQALAMTELRRRLQILGTSGLERKVVLANALARTHVRQEDPARPARTLRAISQALASAQPVLDQEWHFEGESLAEKFETVRLACASRALLFARWAERIEAGETFPTDLITKQVELMVSALENFVGRDSMSDPNILDALVAQPGLLATLFDLRIALSDQKPAGHTVDADEIFNQDRDDNDFLRIISSVPEEKRAVPEHYLAENRLPGRWLPVM